MTNQQQHQFTNHWQQQKATANVRFKLVTLREAHGYSQRRWLREADEAATTALKVATRVAVDHCVPGHDSATR